MMWSTSALIALVLLATVVIHAIRHVSASEQSWNPPNGWNETNFLNMLSENTSDVHVSAFGSQEPELHISFTLYTRQNKTNGRPISCTQIPNIFIANKLTVFIVHGWMSSNNEPWIIDMKNALLSQVDCNVIVVSWDSREIRYFPSVHGTLWVGLKIALLAKCLVNNGLNRVNVYCVGHSLGAHACGSAGRRISGFTLGRITGLDPAGPLFDGASAKIRPGLRRECADLVDVIHTDVDGFGTTIFRGHIDFYPNGGTIQPGCKAILSLKEHGCSHSRAIDLYISSITQPKNCFLANPRKNLCSMGWYADKCLIRGVYNLQTLDKSPFCMF